MDEPHDAPNEDDALEVVAISDDDELYRRLYPTYIKDDGTVSSAAYMDRRRRPDHSISVDLARLSTPEATQARGGSGFRIGVIRCGVARDLDFSVRHAPEVDNRAHSLIEGQNTKQKCYELARATSVVL